MRQEDGVGFLSWLFPSVSDKVEKARRLMADERYAEARLLVIGLDDASAKAVVVEAEQALVKLNVEKAIQRARAGDFGQVNSHLELAKQFHDGSLESLFDDAKEQIEAYAAEGATDAVWRDLKVFAQRRQRLGADPGDFTLSAYSGTGSIRLFFGGERPFNLPGLEVDPLAQWFKPGWIDGSELDSDAFATRYADALGRELGPSDAETLEQLQLIAQSYRSEKPEDVVLQLLERTETDALLSYELGRAAAALGCHQAAILSFKQAEMDFGAPFSVERLSTRFWIAVCALWARDMDTAVTALQDIGDDSPPHITAAVCIEAGRLDEARDVLDVIPDDDDEKPQLLGALKLAVALERVIEEHPVIADESAQGTAAWNDALEQATATLQGALEDVLGELRAFGGEEF